EDGIRDFHVTGVQTCALPISGSGSFTNPDCWAEDDLIHLFSTRPAFGPDLGQSPLLLYTTDDTSIQIPCSDDIDGQSVEVSARRSEERRGGKGSRLWVWPREG